MTPVLPAEPTRWVPVEGGVRLATWVRGPDDAPNSPVVMINGLGASAHDWGPLLALLGTERRIVVFDNRGAGRSAIPDDPVSLELLASDTVAVMDAHGIESADVIGYSMGGMIAQLVALEHPGRLRRLVLLGTHPGARSAVRSRPRARAVLSPEEDLPREDLVRIQYEAFVAPGFREREPETFEEMLGVRMSHLAPLYAWRRQLQAVVESERAERIPGIRAPTLVIHGEADPLIPLENGRMLAELIPGARLVTLSDSGHMLNWEAPEAVAVAVLSFLS